MIKNHDKHTEGLGRGSDIKKEKKRKTALIMMNVSTYPASFTLIFECFFGVLCCRLDVIHCMFNMIFYAINHLTLI